MARINLLMVTEPRLPPATSRTGLSGVKPQIFNPCSRLPVSNSGRIGLPVSTRLSVGRCFMVSGKVAQTVLANGRASRLARPGVRSDSCRMTGIRFSQAPMVTGNATKPPLEKTTWGRRFCNKR